MKKENENGNVSEPTGWALRIFCINWATGLEWLKSKWNFRLLNENNSNGNQRKNHLTTMHTNKTFTLEQLSSANELKNKKNNSIY